MKKIILSLAIALSSYCAYAQWVTNTTTGVTSTANYVGIGTTSPTSLLTINGPSGSGIIMQNNGANVAGFAVSTTNSTWYGGWRIGLNMLTTEADINFQTGNTPPQTVQAILPLPGRRQISHVIWC